MFGRRFLTIAVLMSLSACASGQNDDISRGGRDLTVLAGEELHAQPGITLYDQIRRVRPNWLTPRGASMPGQGDPIMVYRDGVRLGGIAYLRDFSVDIVESVRFLSGPEAASRFGLDHQNGAILVMTRK
jgi:hypothetical protein